MRSLNFPQLRLSGTPKRRNMLPVPVRTDVRAAAGLSLSRHERASRDALPNTGNTRHVIFTALNLSLGN